jgi:subtilase family serine protease
LPFLPKLVRAAALMACLLAPAGLLPQPRPSRITLTFSLTADQQSDLDRLLEAQHDPDSPEFHRWLTPEEFGERFGPTGQQLDDAAAWLRAEGLTVEDTARSRRWMVASGTSSPTRLPGHLAGVVATIRRQTELRWTPSRLQPRYAVDNGEHALAPADLAAIYGVAGDGAGQTIGILGHSNFYLADVQEFRARFGLPERVPRVILIGEEPGFDPNGGMLEALVDLEWSGAVAPKADLVYVYSRDILDALRAAVERNVAPVLNFSFGICEANVPPAEIETVQSLVRQANAQGITFVAGSGDNGSAACNHFGNVATLGLNVMFPASLPEATAVGGTLLNEGSGSYWSNGAATGYIPEVAWNDTPRRPVFTASGGGASMLYRKPRWQLGPGVPPKDARHIPDVAFAASPVHDPYVVIAGNTVVLLGGTSVTAPVFAGLMAVVNQRVGRMGNINPMLYAHQAPWFHDIVEGDNIVQCFPGTRDCVDGSFGFRAGPGYDPVTGLGSIDIPTFVNGVAARIGKRPIRRPPVR